MSVGVLKEVKEHLWKIDALIENHKDKVEGLPIRSKLPKRRKSKRSKQGEHSITKRERSNKNGNVEIDGLYYMEMTGDNTPSEAERTQDNIQHEEGTRGMYNKNNNCWLNSTVQALNMVLKNCTALNIESLRSIHNDCEANSRLLQLTGLCAELHSDTCFYPVDPTPLLETLADTGVMGARQFTFGEEHDSHELLLILLQDLVDAGLFQPFSLCSE